MPRLFDRSSLQNIFSFRYRFSFLQSYSFERNVPLGNVRRNLVNFPSSDSAFMAIPSLSQSFRGKIQSDPGGVLMRPPVRPGKSLFKDPPYLLLPDPDSVVFHYKKNRLLFLSCADLDMSARSLLYFTALANICPSMNSIHFSSQNAVASPQSMSTDIPLEIRSCFVALPLLLPYVQAKSPGSGNPC